MDGPASRRKFVLGIVFLGASRWPPQIVIRYPMQALRMWWRYPHNPTVYDDDWEDQPGQGPLYQWGLGAVLPLVLASYGIYAIIMRQIDFGSRITMTFRGPNAVAFGIAWCGAALFVHCHYFWGNIYNQAWFAVLGKIIAACGFIGGLIFVLVRNGVFGIG